MLGITKNYVKVKIKYEPSLVNKITPVKIVDVEDLVAVGEIVKD